MKVRQGFVSNSSSSSFVILASKNLHDSVLAKLGDYAATVVGAVGANETTFLGQKCVIVSWITGNNDTLEFVEVDDDPSGKYESKYDVMDAYKEQLEADANEDLFIHSEEF